MKRTEEYKIRHNERESARYWELHKNDTKICIVCQKEYLQILRRGTTKTCSIECQEANKKRNDKNRDKEKKSKYQKEYYGANKTKLLEYQQDYRKSPKGKEAMKQADAKRVAMKRQRYYLMKDLGKKTKETVLQLIVRLELNPTCISCNAEKDLTIDHVIPLSKGGDNSISNIQILCRKCNSSKNNRM